MATGIEFDALIAAIAEGRTADAVRLLAEAPELAGVCLDRAGERFLDRCGAQLYAGDTALHVAALSYNVEVVAHLVDRGADVRARNRRGAESLHAATTGGPGSDRWDPSRQREVIETLVDFGAAVDARASGGVTPLHRAVRNRCADAVDALLRAGADPLARNDHGSTALDLARWTTGRGGSGGETARAEQVKIIKLLTR